MKNKLSLLATAALLSATAAHAASFTWDAGGTDSLWSTPENWNPDGAPSASAVDNIINLGTNPADSPDTGVLFNVNRLEFNTNTTFTTVLAGNINWTKTADVTPVQPTMQNTISGGGSNSVMTANWNFDSANLTVNSTPGGSRNMEFQGNITGSGDLTFTKNNSNTSYFLISGGTGKTRDFTGDVIVKNNARLSFGSAGGSFDTYFSDTSKTVTVESGGLLRYLSRTEAIPGYSHDIQAGGTMNLSREGTTAVADYTFAGAVNIDGTLSFTANGANTTSATFNSALTGSGAINAANSKGVTVGATGTLAPGNSIGTLVLNGNGTTTSVLTMATNSKFDFELSGNGGTPDQLSFWNYVDGDLLLNSNAIDLSLLGPQTIGTYTVDIFTFFADGGTTPTTHAFGSGLTIGNLGANISEASIDWNGSGDNNQTIALTYTVVPEPTAALLIGMGGLALILRRRRA